MEKVTILIFLIAQSVGFYGFPMEASRKSPEELSGNFEGDMKLDVGQFRSLTAKVGISNEWNRWPRSQNGTVLVHYTIREGSPYTSFDLQRIQAAFDEIQNKTCIRFARRRNETDYIEIFSGNGCFSNVGRIRGCQSLSLMQSGCLRHGIIIHEFLHALGFFHMHSSHDRDNYVRINYENIDTGREHNFRTYSPSVVSYFGTSYDLDSLMHYGRTAFSKNGRNTIETQNPKDIYRIGQRTRMSPGDVRRVRNMYCVN